VKLAVLAVLLVSSPALADDGDNADDGTYLAPHPDAFWWASGQVNVITQAQPGFHSPYEGMHSLRPDDHLATSIVGTVFGGVEVTKTTALVVAFESAGGGGLSDALGVAGFTNLDVVRNPTLGPAPYIGRAFIDQVVPLGGTYVAADRNALHVLRKLPARRLEIRAGKLSTVDVFDANTGATDSHFQFMNWTIDTNGAYDYAADTRGYTLGAIVEYAAPQWALRYGALLMPTVANGIDYDWDIAKARGENLELELHGCIAGRPGIIRGLAFWNHANMGSYNDAIATFRLMPDVMPDVTASRVPGRVKYGFGLNGEQEVIDELHVFGRIGWNEGEKESFAYTEVDNTVLLGFDLRGGRWSRPNDKLGVAAVTNGISDSHREYLRIGGQGFLLGDGTLHYGREDIVEAYYTARAYRGIFPALDVQLIDHPGYNTDRGPVVVGSFRLHVEI
jgi:hypothetical protein